MALDPRFIINLKGKQFVLFAGLLAEAHANGLIAIETEIQKDLSDPKERAWVVRAIARFKTADGEAVWSAYGDAAPWNTQMKGAELRHAETRSAARVLRMATNIGMTAFEELGPDAEEDTLGQERAGGQVVRPSQQRTAPRQQPREKPAGAPVSRQVGDDVLGAVCDWPDCGLELTVDEVKGCRLPQYVRFFEGRCYCKEHRAARKQQLSEQTS